MAYEYYRNSLPGWGTSQFQLGAPPMPAFQPQPTWTGLDFFNAHAYNPDPSLYQSVMGRLGSFSGIALDHRSAQYWHNMIYSGLTPLTQALPADVGGAAAYEVYRTWKYNTSLYAPLSADRMMQREGLIAMSIAEATRLWQYTGRPMDVYGQRAACEAAAATASHLADRFLTYAYAGTGGAAFFPPNPAFPPYGGVGTGTALRPVAAGTYPYAGSAASYAGGYYPSLGVPAAGSTVVVTRPRRSSHSHLQHSHSNSDDGHHHHHHHPRRRTSVEVIQTGGGGGRHNYLPYSTGGYVAPGYAGYAPGYGYGGGYAAPATGGYGGYGYGLGYPGSGCEIC